MKLAHLFAIAALSLPFAASAEYSYSYAEAGFRYGELADDTGDGFDLKVNFLLGGPLYFAADVDEIEYDNDLHLDRFGLGIGAHFNAFKTVDVYGVLSYEDLEFDIPNATDFSDTGWGAELGARYALNEQWEFKVAGDYAIYESSATEIESLNFVGTAVYFLSNNYQLVGEYIGGEMKFDTANAKLKENNVRIALRIQF